MLYGTHCLIATCLIEFLLLGVLSVVLILVAIFEVWVHMKKMSAIITFKVTYNTISQSIIVQFILVFTVVTVMIWQGN